MEDCVGDNIYHTFAGGDKRGEGEEEAGEGSTDGIFRAITLRSHFLSSVLDT